MKFKKGDKVRVIGVKDEGDFEIGTIGTVHIARETDCIVHHESWGCNITNYNLELVEVEGMDYNLNEQFKRVYVEKFVNPSLEELGILTSTDDIFTKFDTDKSRTDLIDPDFLLKLGEILGFGAKKYGSADNWHKCEDYNRYYAAAMRHLLQWKNGEITDTDSGMNHLINASVNIMFLHYLSTQEKK